MSLNGSGVYTANTSGQPVQNGDTVDPDVFNALITDIATALSTAVFKDGQQTITANLPMANYILTGLGSGLANRGYSARIGDIQDGTATFVDGGGTADAITGTFVPAIPAVVDGMEVCVRATAANATTTPTFSPNGLTARTITKQGGQALAAGDIRADGHELRLRYVAATTTWELLNPTYPTRASLGAASTDAATESAAGLIELATAAETTTGTDDSRAITPKKLTEFAPAAATMDFAADLLLGIDATDSKVKKFGVGGMVAQIVTDLDAAVATGTTAIPYDDSIPQITEGDEYFSVSITPKSATSTLLLFAIVHCGHSAANQMTLALFKDAGADAIAVSSDYLGSTSGSHMMALHHKRTSGGTSAQTFSLRIGSTTGATTTVNGQAGGRKYGGALCSGLIAIEVMP